MPDMERIPVPCRQQVVFLVLDMQAGALDAAVMAMLQTMAEESVEMYDRQVKLAVMTCGESIQWLTPDGPVAVEDFVWRLPDRDGVDAACGGFLGELADKMNRKTFLGSEVGNWCPGVIFVSAGGFQRPEERDITLLKNNKWYQNAWKWVVEVGNRGSGLTDMLSLTALEQSLRASDSGELPEVLADLAGRLMTDGHKNPPPRGWEAAEDVICVDALPNENEWI